MAQGGKRTGDYPIKSVKIEEVERLRLQREAWAPDARFLLDRIGIGEGWRCLDLGCGPKGLTDVLSERVGPSGKIIGLDYNPAFVKIAREGAASNTEIVEGDAYATGMPSQSFDFVHMRFLASTSGQPEMLVVEAKRLLRPGGIFAAQEADGRSLNCHPPHPAWDQLRHALEVCLPDCFGEDPVAHRLFRLMRQAGFEEVCFRPALVSTHSDHPWWDYLPSTSESMRVEYLERGLFDPSDFDKTLAECRLHLANPDTIVTSTTMTQTWGRAPDKAKS